MRHFKKRFSILNRINLVTQIILGLLLGILLSQLAPDLAIASGLLGDIFITALKSVAPILVLILVASAIASHKKEQKSNMKPIFTLYVLGTFLSALVAVIASFMFPTKLTLVSDNVAISPPAGVIEVLQTLVMKMVDNPLNALLNANYIGLIVWGIGLGIALRQASETTKQVIHDFSFCITFIVRLIIRFAPIGIFGLVGATIAKTGFAELLQYAHLLIVLIGSMLTVVLILNPLLIFWKTRENPYPIVWIALKESGITAFFTRSSAANIPVNLALCKKLRLREETYSVSIPLGAAINMAGAAITITVLTLAATYTLGIQIDMGTALILSLVASVCACGASGVAGGSLLLIPIACNLFGISNEIAMQVVAVGFIIGVIQDSAETAINSSSDVMFTAAICRAEEKKLANS